MTGAGVGWSRGVRSAAVTAASVGLAGLGHSLVGGMPLPPLGVAVALALAAPAGWAATGRRLNFGPLVALLAGGQVLAHLTFTIVHGIEAARATGPAAGAVIGNAVTHAGMTGHGVTNAGQTGSSGVTGMAGMDMSGHGTSAMGLPSARMLVGHALATLVLAAAFAWGERLLWQVRRLVPRWAVVEIRLPGRAPVVRGGEWSAYIPGVCRRARPTRGPPARVA